MAKADRTVGAAKRICLLLNILRDEDQYVTLDYLVDLISEELGHRPTHSTIWRDMDTLCSNGIVERKTRLPLRGHLFKLVQQKGQTIMDPYIKLVQDILQYGERRDDRTGVGTLSIFDAKLSFDLRHRFPLVTLKETRWKIAFLEMLWFLRGEATTKWLNEHGCKLWDAWAESDGYLGPIYGVQWRRWQRDGYENTHDQVRDLIKGLRENPTGRRHIVTAWNVADINDMALPPCHWAYQCYVTNDKHLDLKVFIRSSDVALGLPFNVAAYALLCHLYARAAGLTARRLVVDIGDAHLYLNHVDAMREAVNTRAPVDCHPMLWINTRNTDIDGYKPDDFDITGYTFHPHIPLPVAV